jgi:hypothetical protein
MYKALKKLLAKLNKLSFDELFYIKKKKNSYFHCECPYTLSFLQPNLKENYPKKNK